MGVGRVAATEGNSFRRPAKADAVVIPVNAVVGFGSVACLADKADTAAGLVSVAVDAPAHAGTAAC